MVLPKSHKHCWHSLGVSNVPFRQLLFHYLFTTSTATASLLLLTLCLFFISLVLVAPGEVRFCAAAPPPLHGRLISAAQFLLLLQL